MPKEDKYKLSEESARKTFDEFIDYYEIDPEDIKETEAKNGLERVVEKMIKYIRLGRVEIKIEKEGMKVIQHLKRPPGEMKEIEYGEISGRNKTQMKDKNPNDFHGRLYAMMGSLSGLGEKAMLDLKGVDLALVECLGALFLNV
jgi:hypothetical protein